MKISKCAIFEKSFDIPEGLKGVNIDSIDSISDESLNDIDFTKHTLIKIPEPDTEEMELFKEIPYNMEYIKCGCIGEYANNNTNEYFICCNMQGEPLNLEMSKKGRINGQVDEAFVKIDVHRVNKIIELKAIMIIPTVEKNAEFVLFEYVGKSNNVKIPKKYECFTNVINKTIEKSFNKNIKVIHFYTDIEMHPNYKNIVAKYQHHIDKGIEDNSESKPNHRMDEQERKKTWSIYQLCKGEVLELIYKNNQEIEIPSELRHSFLQNHTVVQVPTDSSMYGLLKEIKGDINYIRMNIFCEDALIGDNYSNVTINCKPNFTPFDKVYHYNDKLFTQTPFYYIRANAVRLNDSLKITIDKVRPDIPHPTEKSIFNWYGEDINEFDINLINEKYRHLVTAIYEKSFAEKSNDLFMYQKF